MEFRKMVMITLYPFFFKQPLATFALSCGPKSAKYVHAHYNQLYLLFHSDLAIICPRDIKEPERKGHCRT